LSAAPANAETSDSGASAADRDWVADAVRLIEADFNRSADTHLVRVDLPRLAAAGVDLYLKNDSTHPSGSLKHRLARSLFLYGLCNGWIKRGKPVVESSSGSTAISEAYFARLLDLPFVAVAPRTTAKPKIEAIEFLGGEVRLAEPAQIYDEARKVAEASGGHYMDQFTYAERATDWRGNNNIAESLFAQMGLERYPAPAWVVVSAGTGGTSSTIGRYMRYSQRAPAATRLCVVDPENSVFFDSYRTGDRGLRIDTSSRIEGIGRPRVESSFIASVIDRMIRAPDSASIATIHWLETVIGRKCGGSTGTNLYAALILCGGNDRRRAPRLDRHPHLRSGRALSWHLLQCGLDRARGARSAPVSRLARAFQRLRLASASATESRPRGRRRVAPCPQSAFMHL
jgi:cysteine synthase